jgi:hypothetical protein
MTFFIALGPDNLTKILLLVFLGGYLFWGILRDYRLVSHWEYKIWDMRRGADREGMESEIHRMRELGEEGWECYAVLKMPDDNGAVHREYHFKRKRSVLNLGFKRTKTGTSTQIKAGPKKD